jgi:hypothetical protein
MNLFLIIMSYVITLLFGATVGIATMAMVVINKSDDTKKKGEK